MSAFPLRPGMPPLPRRMRALPVEARGFPVPWFVEWIDGRPDFRVVDSAKLVKAIKFGKRPANRRAERSLYARATGYTYDAEELFLIDEVIERHNAEDPDRPTMIRTKKVLRVPIVKHVPPDTGALAFWLKNRERDKWRDKQDHEIAGKGGEPIAFELSGNRDTLVIYYARLAAIAAEKRSDTNPLSSAGQDGDYIDGSDGGD